VEEIVRSFAVYIDPPVNLSAVKLRPLRGAALPKVDLLMELPKEVTDKHIDAAYKVLRSGAPGYLQGGIYANYPRHVSEHLSNGERERIARYQATLGEARRQYVELAVHKMWREHAPERFLEVLKTKGEEVNYSRRGNTLYRLTRALHDSHSGRGGTRERVDYFLAYKCPSTGKTYISGVPYQSFTKTTRKADAAMAWKFGLKLKEYDDLEEA
jgi:hypothetical protein